MKTIDELIEAGRQEANAEQIRLQREKQKAADERDRIKRMQIDEFMTRFADFVGLPEEMRSVAAVESIEVLNSPSTSARSVLFTSAYKVIWELPKMNPIVGMFSWHGNAPFEAEWKVKTGDMVFEYKTLAQTLYNASRLWKAQNIVQE